jgi:hypothetical protein
MPIVVYIIIIINYTHHVLREETFRSQILQQSQ